MQYIFILVSALVVSVSADSLCSTSPGYDVQNVINVVNLQFCTIVEIGQGFCSVFLEFRSRPSCEELSRESVAELYLGSCSCATLRTWELCSIPLRKAHPYACSFDEGHSSAESTGRVHRRLCDPTYMASSGNPVCDCSQSFAGRTLYPVEGFQTCYRAPMPKSICSTHSVCGVSRCATKLIFGLALVQCDPNCLGGKPFCEENTDVSSKPPIVTSVWSEWTSVKKLLDCGDEQVDEAICLEEGTWVIPFEEYRERTRNVPPGDTFLFFGSKIHKWSSSAREKQAPAFDCLGPGSFCCPKEAGECSCIVTTTMAEMKVTRRIKKKSIKIAEFKRIEFISKPTRQKLK